jgi:DnaA N-terminal domain
MALSGNPSQSPQQIWEQVLSLLQSDISRVYFETWVKPAIAMSFSDNVFTLGCHNAYAVKWLESRLKSTLERVLFGLYGEPVRVAFTLLSSEFLKEEEGKSVEVDPMATNADIDLAYIEPIFNSLRDALLEPGRVVKMPVYFLRWLPYVGARTIFEVVGLWQEYYLNSRGKQPKGGEKVSTRIERVCRWTGVSRAQLFRDLTPGGQLSWFLNKIETDHELDHGTGRSKKSANKYSLFGIPLTPGDAEDLVAYLAAVGGKENPRKALQVAIEAQPHQILHYPFRVPPDNFDQMRPMRITVQEVIKEVVRHRMDQELSDFSDQLADRLLGAGDFILVSWYFLHNWLPLLGPNVAMLIVLLRNLCYFNDETGEIRDEVWLEGGNKAIASRLGIDNPRQVAQWFPAILERGGHKDTHTPASTVEISRRQKLQEAIALFVTRTDFRTAGNGSYDWHFKVKRMDPLLPEHDLVKRSAANLLVAAEDQSVLPELYMFLEWLPNDCFETLKKDPMLVLRLSKIDNACLETLATILNDCFETVKDLPNGCFETLLKILKSFKDSQKEKESSTNQDSASFKQTLPHEVGGGKSQNGNWSFEKILARVNPKIREQLIRQEQGLVPLISWILYGAANTTIKDPISLAISKLKGQPGLTAGGSFDRLAGLPQEVFCQFLRSAFTWQGTSDRDWQAVFRGVEHDRLILLADIFEIQIDSGGEL